jgi:RimJ/RimL family protein N-acetyltransferase
MTISGKNINLRTVTPTDAEFIFTLRNNKIQTKYLSSITGSVNDQKNWIINYKERENDKKEFYFIIESKNTEKLGLVRLYDFQENSFCWGSWVIKEQAPMSTAIESALQIYEFAFYQLNFESSHFDVRKNNTKVINFHKRFGAKIISENEIDYFFIFNREAYEKTKLKYKRYL